MSRAIVGLCTIEFHLDGLTSLKDKRSILKSMLAKLHNTFNVSAAEISYQDQLDTAGIAVAAVTNSSRHANEMIHTIINWIETNFPEAMIVKQEIEIL